MTRLHQAMPHHAHRPCAHVYNGAPRARRSAFADDWRGGGASSRGVRERAHLQGRRTAEAPPEPEGASRAGLANAAFALTLLTVAGVVGVAATANVPNQPSRLSGPSGPSGPFTRLRAAGRSGLLATTISPLPFATLPHSAAISGMRALLHFRPQSGDGGVTPRCLPAPHARALGESPAPTDSDAAAQLGLSAYREDLQRVVVAMIRDAVANADMQTREAFANAEVLHPRYMTFRIDRKGSNAGAPPSVYFAPLGITLHLRDERGRWRTFALSLSAQAATLITPIVPCGSRNRAGTWCLARTLGPLFWGERWAAIESSAGETDEVRFAMSRAGAAVSPGWPSPDTPVLESPDMEEVAEILLETVIAGESRGAGVVRAAAALPRFRRDAGPASALHAAPSRALASRLTVSGLECLAAVIGGGSFHDDAIALLQHLWPARPETVAAPVDDTEVSPGPVAVNFPHEPFSGPLGRGVQWSLPPDVYVEYRPEMTQNGVKVFEIDGTLYGTTVAKTRKHASDLRPLDALRNELGPLSLCRISRGVGIDVDGMCLECHTEREGEVSVTEQGATVAQHQALEASPMVRLRVAVYSQSFDAPDGRRRFFAFGRLGEFDEYGVPHVTSDCPVVDAALYVPVLRGELAYYEQATTDGPVGGRRVQLTLGDMHVAAPFGTYRDRHDTLHGVVQISHDVFYRFTLPVGDVGASTREIHLHYRHTDHRDIREYWIAQHHRAAAENAIVLPSISYGETRTLLQLYLRIWEQAPSPAAVWRGLEDIPLSVVEARHAVADMTRVIEHRVAAARRTGEREAVGNVADEVDGREPPPAPAIDAALLPTFNRLWAHWQRYPTQADAFINAVARDFVSRPAPLAVWSQLPFVSDIQTTRDVLSIFETVFPSMEGLQSLVTGRARAARDVQDQMRRISRDANIAVAEVTLVDGTRTIYYCISGLQRSPLPTNAPTVRFVDAGQAYARRENSVITQHRNAPRSQPSNSPTEPPALRLVVADANMPTYNVASGEAKSRTLDTERLILAQIYADHPAGENVVRSIVMCSRMPFCDSCAVNLAMTPYHYPDAALRFYYVASAPRRREPGVVSTPATHDASQTRASRSRQEERPAHANP